MTVYHTILKRRTIRKYSNKEVSQEKIEQLLRAAMAAPSANNKKPWLFYVVKNKEIQEQLKKVYSFFDYNSPLLIVVAGNLESQRSKTTDFWQQDCSAAVQNILLLATELGLGSCWCGIYPRKERVQAIRKILNLTDEIVPLALIHLGYPAEEKSARTQYEEAKVIEIS